MVLQGFPTDARYGWTVFGRYNGLAYYANGHIHREAPAWWHLRGLDSVIPTPHQCPQCDEHDEGDDWYARELRLDDGTVFRMEK